MKGNLSKSTEKHKNVRLRRAIGTEITTKCIVLSHLNPPEGRKFFWRCFWGTKSRKDFLAGKTRRKKLTEKTIWMVGISSMISNKLCSAEMKLDCVMEGV